jgi:hypothetical protein
MAHKGDERGACKNSKTRASTIGRICAGGFFLLLCWPLFRMFFSRPVVWRRLREALQALRPTHEAMDTTRLNLILYTPVIPKENILLIEGIHDLFLERQSIEELWQKWEQPEIWRLPHGHISGLFVPGLMGRVLRWLSPRLDK